MELDDIVEAARQSRLIKNPYKSIMQRKYRPQLVIAVIFMIFQQFDVSARALLPQLPWVFAAQRCRCPAAWSTTSWSVKPLY